MFLREIQIPVSHIRGVGPTSLKQLKRLGIETVGDLLSWWPRDWDDRTSRQSLAEFERAKSLHSEATVMAHDWFGFGRMRTLKITIQDDEGTIAELICFNRPFLEKQYPVGSRVVVHGHFHWKYGSIQSSSFDIELEQHARAELIPIYSLTAGLTNTQLRKIITRARSEYGRGIDSELPKKIRETCSLPAKQDIVKMMHAPDTLEEARTAARALIFEEFFVFEYALGKRAMERRGKLPEIIQQESVPVEEPASICLSGLQKRIIERLPFTLTDDQLRVVSEINHDLDSVSPMARLLQGDVGSGKTLVAFLTAAAIAERNGQSALLAPTELLARQHAENAARILEPVGIRIAFLTGNIKAAGRSRLLAELADGHIDIVIGTHALFSRGVTYRNLSLVLIDEQHRFGVMQRAAIIEKGREGSPEPRDPHLLMMSATPIPRTLALSVFGDLDVSVIRTMPLGRKPVITHLARHGNEKKVYDFVRHELAQQRQAYFVYPLIEDQDGGSLKSAEMMHEKLEKDIFPGITSELIHSRIPEDEQRAIMHRFREGSTRILVATSVVEVGVDVPNATCMVIEHAERFGLSALHQLRGRVGRGPHQSWCFLVYSGNLTEYGKNRLKVLHETTDGFVIAEEDLRLRGPGDVGGIQQSGYIAFTLADPVRDADILEQARTAAFSLILEESHSL